MRYTALVLVGCTMMIALSSCRTWAAPPPAKTDHGNAVPVIQSPKDKQRIGGEGDLLCGEQDKPCTRIRAEGWVPEQRTPFFAVEPLLASPRMWIQPPIHGVKSDGSFSSLINLGEAEKGAGEYFKIYLLACEDQERFREGEEILQFPKDCQVSEPVEVYRER